MVDEHELLLGRVLRQQPQERRFLGAGGDGPGAGEQGGPARVLRVAIDKARDGGGRRRRRGPRGSQQVLQRGPDPTVMLVANSVSSYAAA